MVSSVLLPTLPPRILPLVLRLPVDFDCVFAAVEVVVVVLVVVVVVASPLVLLVVVLFWHCSEIEPSIQTPFVTEETAGDDRTGVFEDDDDVVVARVGLEEIDHFSVAHVPHVA